MPTGPIRIASLVPSITELLMALGLGPCLVARTGYCVHPKAELASVPKVGGTKTVNVAKLRRLAPSHVIVNVDENRLETVETLRTFVPHVLVTHPCAPHDNLELVHQMAAAFGAQPRVAERAEAIERALADELARTTPQGRAPRQVLYLIWHEPWMTVARDTYLSQMLARVNWHTLPAQEGGAAGAARYPVVEPGSPWLAEVQEVLLSSEPFAFGPDHAEAARRLCPAATVRQVDGELLSWYGVRAIEGLRYLRRLAG